MNKQSGVGLLGALIIAALFISISVVALRVAPVYLEYYSIKRSVTSLQSLKSSDLSTTDPTATAILLKKRLMNQLDLNNIKIPEEQIQVSPTEKGSYSVSVKYQTTKPLAGHVKLLFDFDEKQEVRINGT